MSKHENVEILVRELRAQSPSFPENLLDKIRFNMVGEGLDFDDQNEVLRSSVIEYLYSGHALENDLPLLRFLLEQEKQFSSACSGSTENTYMVATLITLFGELSDIFILWDVKYETFDLSFGVSAEYLFIRGETTKLLDYITNSTHDDKNEILDYLNFYVQNGILEEWIILTQAQMKETFNQHRNE